MSSIYLSNAIFMMIILTIIFLRIRYYITWSPSKKYTMIFIGMVELYVLMDALFMKELLGKSGNLLQFKLVVFFFYLVYVIMPYVWHLFMQSYMGINRSKKQRFAEMIPFILLILMVLLSVPTGIVWRFSRNRTYIRGTFFGVFAVLNLFYYVYTFAQTFFILFMNNTKGVRYLIKSALFSAVPLIGILVNTYIIPLYGAYPFQPYCLVIGALLSYLFMVEHQQDQMEFEHRKRLSKALELEKESTRKAKVAGEVKNAFLANMSHDIRTPMNAIIGFSDIIAEHPDDEEIVKNAISKIQASGEILLKIINDVLDLSKIESGKAEIVEMVTDLKQMEENLKMMLEYSIQKGMIDFKVEDQIENPLVWCDATKLQQVLVNVLNNAVKFTPAGGTITFSCVQRMIAPGFAEYKFTIKDTGIGMSQEFVQKIFSPFERERTSTVSRTQGTGLGMAITKNIVDMMGGTIEVQTEQGKGTEFIVCLPLRIQSERQRIEKIAELEGLKALVVDDDFNTCDSVTKMLVRVGMRSEWTLSGKEAVLRARQSMELGDAFHAYIIDWRLPDMNGIEVTRQIRSLGDDTPIIILTAYDWSDIEAEARAAGVTAFCAKPLFMSDIRDTLMTAIGQSQAEVEDSILPEAGSDFRGRCILLVEDNELNSEIAVEILKGYGFLVDTVENGAEAVEKVKNSTPGKYDLVLMDVQMPVMNGYEATRQIRALDDPALSGITILAMTANAFDEDRKKALEYGMDGFLSKPIVIEELISTLHNNLLD